MVTKQKSKGSGRRKKTQHNNEETGAVGYHHRVSLVLAFSSLFLLITGNHMLSLSCLSKSKRMTATTTVLSRWKVISLNWKYSNPREAAQYAHIEKILN